MKFEIYLQDSGSYISVSKLDFIKKHGLLQSENLGSLLAM